MGGTNVNLTGLAGGEYSVHFFADSTSAWTSSIAVTSPATVPEPSSALLGSLGLGALAFRRKRKA